MPQLHFYVPDTVAAKLRGQAEAAGMSLSRYIAEVVKRESGSDWPEGFFDEVVGGWQGEPLQRPSRGQFEEREPLNP